MNVNGELKLARLQQVASGIAQKLKGLIYFDKDNNVPVIDTGSEVDEIVIKKNFDSIAYDKKFVNEDNIAQIAIEKGINGNFALLPDNTELGPIYYGSVVVQGNAIINQNTVIYGDLIIEGNLVQSGTESFNFEVHGDTKIMGYLENISDATVETAWKFNGDLLVEGTVDLFPLYSHLGQVYESVITTTATQFQFDAKIPFKKDIARVGDKISLEPDYSETRTIIAREFNHDNVVTIDSEFTTAPTNGDMGYLFRKTPTSINVKPSANKKDFIVKGNVVTQGSIITFDLDYSSAVKGGDIYIDGNCESLVTANIEECSEANFLSLVALGFNVLSTGYHNIMGANAGNINIKGNVKNYQVLAQGSSVIASGAGGNGGEINLGGYDFSSSSPTGLERITLDLKYKVEANERTTVGGVISSRGGHGARGIVEASNGGHAGSIKVTGDCFLDAIIALGGNVNHDIVDGGRTGDSNSVIVGGSVISKGSYFEISTNSVHFNTNNSFTCGDAGNLTVDGDVDVELIGESCICTITTFGHCSAFDIPDSADGGDIKIGGNLKLKAMGAWATIAINASAYAGGYACVGAYSKSGNISIGGDVIYNRHPDCYVYQLSAYGSSLDASSSQKEADFDTVWNSNVSKAGDIYIGGNVSSVYIDASSNDYSIAQAQGKYGVIIVKGEMRNCEVKRNGKSRSSGHPAFLKCQFEKSAHLINMYIDGHADFLGGDHILNIGPSYDMLANQPTYKTLYNGSVTVANHANGFFLGFINQSGSTKSVLNNSHNLYFSGNFI
ncbi:hypothetical protein [Flavobacterium alkalisoli]|uniref:hypothetical protein n=1 Tax=Flavobacterium alkalisoli TaxID=2602769 RepID=UPI003A8EA71C